MNPPPTATIDPSPAWYPSHEPGAPTSKNLALPDEAGAVADGQTGRVGRRPGVVDVRRCMGPRVDCRPCHRVAREEMDRAVDLHDDRILHALGRRRVRGELGPSRPHVEALRP